MVWCRRVRPMRSLPRENGALRTVVEALTARSDALQAENAELKRWLGQDSRNSSKPPSSDSPFVKPAPRLVRRDGREPGGQPGHPGSTLEQVADPHERRRHEPGPCTGCGGDLSGASEVGIEHRHVFDLPPMAVWVTEHQLIARRCGRRCGRRSAARATARTGAHAAGLARCLALGRYERTSIAHIESGSQSAPREFWECADELLCAGGALLADFDEVERAPRSIARDRPSKSTSSTAPTVAEPIWAPNLGDALIATVACWHRPAPAGGIPRADGAALRWLLDVAPADHPVRTQGRRIGLGRSPDSRTPQGDR